MLERRASAEGLAEFLTERNYVGLGWPTDPMFWIVARWAPIIESLSTFEEERRHWPKTLTEWIDCLSNYTNESVCDAEDRRKPYSLWSFLHYGYKDIWWSAGMEDYNYAVRVEAASGSHLCDYCNTHMPRWEHWTTNLQSRRINGHYCSWDPTTEYPGLMCTRCLESFLNRCRANKCQPTDEYAAEEWLALRLKRGDFWRVPRPERPLWEDGYAQMIEQWGTPDCRFTEETAGRFYEWQIAHYTKKLETARRLAN